MQKTIAIGCDHTGVNFKNEIIKNLHSWNYAVIDCGVNECDKTVDYPDFAKIVANYVVLKKADYGVVICGTGIGISIAANKVKGIRCALVYEEATAKLAREHNDANVIAFGARIIAVEKAISILATFLKTAPSTEVRHKKRIAKIE